MHHREYVIEPSQQATTGALDLFVEACRTGNLRQQLFALSVLGSATESQLDLAMPSVQATQQVTRADIAAMLTR
ncbi:MAG TPA: hypothetical protein VEQ65_04400 [Opitutus sp.]|nr:hypothetical protein [Opitutus sp.]